MRSIKWAAIICLAAVAADGFGASVAADQWKAAVARQAITPQQPMWLAGYSGRNHPAQHKLHELWLKVLVIEDEHANRAVLITSDVLGYSRQMYESILARLAKIGYQPRQIMLTASHTHSGPVTRDCLLDYYPIDADELARINAYSDELEATILRGVEQATAALAPVAIEMAVGESTFAVNRRNNREPEVPAIIARGDRLAGPVDHRVPVLVIKQLADPKQMLAVVFGYACHNTTLDGYEWCGDYAGFAQLEIERQHPETCAMFWTGCGADQNPLPRRSVALCERYGKQLAAAVEATLASPHTQVQPRLGMARLQVDLRFDEQPTREALERHLASPGVRGRWAARQLAVLDAGNSQAASYPYTIQAWQLGSELTWLALAGEVVVDYALRAQSQFGQGTWTASYAHDLVAYIPSRRVYDEGGYEGGSLYEYGLPAERWTPDVEQVIFAGIERAVAEARAAAESAR